MQEPHHGDASTPARDAETVPPIICAKADNELDPHLTKLIAVIDSGGRVPKGCTLFLEDFATLWDIAAKTFRKYLRDLGVLVGSVGEKTLITAADLLQAIPRESLPGGPEEKAKEANDG